MEGIDFLDGGFGTMVQAAGLPPGKDPTDWNVENPDAVASVHRAYHVAPRRYTPPSPFLARPCFRPLSPAFTLFRFSILFSLSAAQSATNPLHSTQKSP